MNLSSDVKLTLVQAGLADGQTDPDSAAVDMQGFEGVMFVGLVGTITGSGTVTLTAQQSADSGGSPDAFDALTGAAAVATASAQSDKLLVVDVYRPAKRYVRTALTRAVANSVYGGTLAIQYAAGKRPTTHTAASIAQAVLAISPAEA